MMPGTETTVFVSYPNTDDNPTEPIIPIKWFKIVLTVESKNPYLDGKHTEQPMLVTREIAELMFHQTVTTYEEMPGGGPYRKVGDWKWKGRYAGETVTLELVG